MNTCHICNQPIEERYLNLRSDDEGATIVNSCKSCHIVGASYSKWKQKSFGGYKPLATLRPNPKAFSTWSKHGQMRQRTFDPIDASLWKSCVLRTASDFRKDRVSSGPLLSNSKYSVWRGTVDTTEGIPRRVTIVLPVGKSSITAVIPEQGTWNMKRASNFRVSLCDPKVFGERCTIIREEHLGDYVAQTRTLDVHHSYIDFSQNIEGIGTHMQICRCVDLQGDFSRECIYRCINAVCAERSILMNGLRRESSGNISGILTAGAVREMGGIKPVVGPDCKYLETWKKVRWSPEMENMCIMHMESENCYIVSKKSNDLCLCFPLPKDVIDQRGATALCTVRIDVDDERETSTCVVTLLGYISSEGISHPCMLGESSSEQMRILSRFLNIVIGVDEDQSIESPGLSSMFVSKERRVTFEIRDIGSPLDCRVFRTRYLPDPGDLSIMIAVAKGSKTDLEKNGVQIALLDVFSQQGFFDNVQPVTRDVPNARIRTKTVVLIGSFGSMKLSIARLSQTCRVVLVEDRKAVGVECSEQNPETDSSTECDLVSSATGAVSMTAMQFRKSYARTLSANKSMVTIFVSSGRWQFVLPDFVHESTALLVETWCATDERTSEEVRGDLRLINMTTKVSQCHPFPWLLDRCHPSNWTFGVLVNEAMKRRSRV